MPPFHLEIKLDFCLACLIILKFFEYINFIYRARNDIEDLKKEIIGIKVLIKFF